MENKTVLHTDAIDAALTQLPGWRRDGKFLRKDYVFANFREINAFLPYLTATVVRLNHHPDFSFVSGRKLVQVEVTTHSAGCVTQADLDLAAALEAWPRV